MSKIRCVNCGICLDDVVRVGVKYTTLINISEELLAKLKSWIPVPLKPNYRLCGPCVTILNLPRKQRLVNRLICLVCGEKLTLETSQLLTKDELEVGRAWVAGELSVNHLSRACLACYERLKMHSAKIESEFIAVDHHNIDRLSESDTEIKYEPEIYEENHLSMKDNPLGNHISFKDEPSDQEDINIENLSDPSDVEVKCEYLDNDIDTSDNIQYEYIVNVDENSENADLIRENEDAGSENGDENSINADENIENADEYSENEDGSSENGDEINENDDNDSANAEIIRNKRKNKRIEDSDEDYVPEGYVHTLSKPQKDVTIVESDAICLHTRSTEGINYITLRKYKRTFRLGCCVFDGCTDDCISLIPRTVRRRMIFEFDLYIPRLSRVCKQHLQDQNWEELVEKATHEFTAHHCQDMKDIVNEACHTNFDFENIETVEARLVRYWFDVNKTEFNRIFNAFPKLKRLKEPKTAFALYLMRLQKTSFTRIALLLKMDKKAIRRKVAIVRDIVNCKSYEELKERFLDDD